MNEQNEFSFTIEPQADLSESQRLIFEEIVQIFLKRMNRSMRQYGFYPHSPQELCNFLDFLVETN